MAQTTTAPGPGVGPPAPPTGTQAQQTAPTAGVAKPIPVPPRVQDYRNQLELMNRRVGELTTRHRALEAAPVSTFIEAQLRRHEALEEVSREMELLTALAKFYSEGTQKAEELYRIDTAALGDLKPLAEGNGTQTKS